MINLYKRITRQCKSINQINRAHIALENWLTPLQWKTLKEELHSDPDYSLVGFNSSSEPIDDLLLAIKKWIDIMERNFHLGLSKEPQPFKRIRLRRYLALYTDTNTPKAKKNLIVCFTGKAQRMMTPLVSFLQNINAKENDVILVTYPKDHGFRKGLEGTASSFEKMIDQLKELVGSQSYNKIVAIGVSGGAIPAVLCAIRAGWDSALAFGAHSLNDERWHDALGYELPILIENYHKNAHHPIPLYFVYGADSKNDYEAAISIKNLLPAKLIEVRSNSERVGHVVLNSILMSGKLHTFFNNTVLAPQNQNLR